jgi:hypothetical protein
MPDDLLTTLLLLVFGVVGLALLYQRFNANHAEPNDAPLRLSGHGTETTRAFPLGAGRYRFNYIFSSESLSAVTLLETATGDRDLLGMLGGSGETSFTLTAPGRFALHVKAAHATRWTLTITPLNLPSQRHKPPKTEP